jgi:hypothetical protein
MRTKMFLFVFGSCLSSISFSSDYLTSNVLSSLKPEEWQALRVTLSTKINVVYKKTEIGKFVEEGKLEEEKDTVSLKVRIGDHTLGKIVNIVNFGSDLKVCFDEQCSENKGYYTFSRINGGRYVLKHTPNRAGYTFKHVRFGFFNRKLISGSDDDVFLKFKHNDHEHSRSITEKAEGVL